MEIVQSSVLITASEASGADLRPATAKVEPPNMHWRETPPKRLA